MPTTNRIVAAAPWSVNYFLLRIPRYSGNDGRRKKTNSKAITKRYALRVCVCVCLYSSTCWFFPAARHLWHTWEVRINDLLLEYIWVLLPSSFISLSESILFHLQRRKLQPTAYWRENDMICLESVEKMIYIDIGNKSARSKPRSYEKILKIRRLL